MKKTHSISLAAAFGAASLLTFAAVAQQAGDTPAPAAPATEQPATEAGRADRAAPPAGPGERWGRGDRMWGGGKGGGKGGHHRFWSNLSEADRKAMMEARIAAVRAGLQLTEEQAKLWGPAETAMREFMQQRLQWRERMRGQERPASPIERMERRADMLSERGASLKKMTQAVRPLYDSLDEDQKRRLGLLSRQFHVGMGMGMRAGMGHHRPYGAESRRRASEMNRGGGYGYGRHGYGRGYGGDRGYGSYRGSDSGSYRGRGYHHGYHGRGYHHHGGGYGRWQ